MNPLTAFYSNALALCTSLEEISSSTYLQIEGHHEPNVSRNILSTSYTMDSINYISTFLRPGFYSNCNYVNYIDNESKKLVSTATT